MTVAPATARTRRYLICCCVSLLITLSRLFVYTKLLPSFDAPNQNQNKMLLHEKFEDKVVQLTTTHEKDEALPLSSSIFDPHDICASLTSSGAFSATRIWQDNLEKILDASTNLLMPPDLQTYNEIAKMRTLLEETLSPSLMRSAIRYI